MSRRGEGTFVTNDGDRISRFSLEFTGFMDDLFYQISKSKTKSVTMGRIRPTKLLREKLNLKKGDEEVIQIKRVRFLENKSFAFTVNYLPMSIGTRISERELLKKPLMQIIEQDLGIEFTEAFQTIQASFSDQEVADLLGIASGSPILFVERIMYAHGRKPVEVVQSSYRGDLYKYTVRLRNFRSKKGPVWVHQAE
jgi:GntR family transcriptional regulator